MRNSEKTQKCSGIIEKIPLHFWVLSHSVWKLDSLNELIYIIQIR